MLAGGGGQALVQAAGVVQGGEGGEGCQDEYFQAVNIVLNIFIMGVWAYIPHSLLRRILPQVYSEINLN